MYNTQVACDCQVCWSVYTHHMIVRVADSTHSAIIRSDCMCYQRRSMLIACNGQVRSTAYKVCAAHVNNVRRTQYECTIVYAICMSTSSSMSRHRTLQCGPVCAVAVCSQQVHTLHHSLLSLHTAELQPARSACVQTSTRVCISGACIVVFHVTRIVTTTLNMP
jgi:hypothetical protein